MLAQKQLSRPTFFVGPKARRQKGATRSQAQALQSRRLQQTQVFRAALYLRSSFQPRLLDPSPPLVAYYHSRILSGAINQGGTRS